MHISAEITHTLWQWESERASAQHYSFTLCFFFCLRSAAAACRKSLLFQARKLTWLFSQLKTRPGFRHEPRLFWLADRQAPAGTGRRLVRRRPWPQEARHRQLRPRPALISLPHPLLIIRTSFPPSFLFVVVVKKWEAHFCKSLAIFLISSLCAVLLLMSSNRSTFSFCCPRGGHFLVSSAGLCSKKE